MRSSADYITDYLEPVGSLVIESKSGEVMARLDLAAAALFIMALAELAGAPMRAQQDADAAKPSEGTET